MEKDNTSHPLRVRELKQIAQEANQLQQVAPFTGA